MLLYFVCICILIAKMITMGVMFETGILDLNNHYNLWNKALVGQVAYAIAYVRGIN